MKHFPLFRNMVLTCGVLAAAASMSSCTALPSPGARADQIVGATNATVFSYNDASSPRNRLCTEAGPLPANVARALCTWLKHSTIKNFAYTYPQYYIAMSHPQTGKQIVWALCSDAQGNLVGILIPRDGVQAWDLPYVGNYRMYVCDTNDRKPLSDAIMETLSDMGYDNARIEARKAMGLTEKQHLISKPLTEAEKERLAELKKKEEEAAKAAEEAAAKASEAAATAAQDDVPTEDPTPDEDDTDTEDDIDAEDTDSDDAEEETTEDDSAEEDSTEDDTEGEDTGDAEEEISEEDSF